MADAVLSVLGLDPLTADQVRVRLGLGDRDRGDVIAALWELEAGGHVRLQVDRGQAVARWRRR